MPSLVCTSSYEEGESLKTPPRLKEEVSRSDGGDSVFNLPPLRSSLFAKDGQFFGFNLLPQCVINLLPPSGTPSLRTRESFCLVFFKTPPLLQRGGVT